MLEIRRTKRRCADDVLEAADHSRYCSADWLYFLFGGVGCVLKGLMGDW